MLVFIKRIFLTGLAFLSSLVSASPLSSISMINQACIVRLEIINLNSNEPTFYRFSIKTSKWTNETNETRHIKWHETCKCECRLDASVCNNKQRWNDDKCWCECKELIDKGVCDKGYAWNPSNCKCECDKSCDVGEYLDYENCKCRKRLVDKLVEECVENIDEAELSEIALFEHGNECVCSYIVCIVLGVIALTICIGVGAYFTYKYMNRNKEKISKCDYVYHAKNN